ncbi:uncharacterized protein LOC100879041 [Megachile rotundata]|uniref:uncharacterized protein LOC100879041 n=1 Tax=Megachile rotundata TaxID=143995 RepID=UPI003FD29D8E
MRVAVILLAFVTALVSAQFNQDIDGGSPPRSLPAPLRSARFQRLPSARPAIPTQAALVNQRLAGARRPITFRPKGAEDSVATGPGALTSFKPLRPNLPNLPSGPPSLPQHVKPVNEEPEEDVRNRDTARDHSNQDDDSELSEEQSESQDESEENVPRAIANLGAVGSISRTSGPTAQSLPVQYRPQTSSLPTGRGGGIQATPAPQPVQYRPAPKPNKPRKPIEEPFKQQVKAPTKVVKTAQSYDGRGKKPVAQIIRRYRNDNPDGSITWGFENDDGSYKEEIIGIDCITRGKYGYIDPDGIRREYTYETGIKCDEEQRIEDEENGFVDYQENKLVLPDGKTIDLSSMGKKQGRRPNYVHRN